MQNDLVSVIMSVYNERKQWLDESICSILNQSYGNLQIIIVLDNPGNADIREYLYGFAANDDRIEFVINEKNQGLVYSLNHALDYVKGKYVARMDADDISDINRIEHEMEFLCSNNLDFVMTNIDYIDEEGIVTNGHEMKDIVGSEFCETEKHANLSTHPTWLAKTEVFTKLNGYRNVRHCEDYDFVLRALQEGFSIGRMSERLLYYRTRSGGVSRSNIAEQFFTMRSLRKAFRNSLRISDMTENDWRGEFISMSVSDRVSFEKAIAIFWDAKKNYSFIGIVKAYLTSHYFRIYFWDNIFSIIWVKIKRK
jgi:glycosyltransferase involved in cell wall biosynthesis